MANKINNPEKRVKELRAEGKTQAEIARILGLTRQAVNHHLSDKTKRRRENIDGDKLKRLREQANGRYRLRKSKTLGFLD